MGVIATSFGAYFVLFLLKEAEGGVSDLMGTFFPESASDGDSGSTYHVRNTPSSGVTYHVGNTVFGGDFSDLMRQNEHIVHAETERQEWYDLKQNTRQKAMKRAINTQRNVTCNTSSEHLIHAA